MAQTIEYQHDLDSECYMNEDLLISLINETILQSTDEIAGCVLSFAYVAIQKFIAHCKDHRIDPLSMSYDEIKMFVDTTLNKELSQEIKQIR